VIELFTNVGCLFVGLLFVSKKLIVLCRFVTGGAAAAVGNFMYVFISLGTLSGTSGCIG
jgi:hypothetical protein